MMKSRKNLFIFIALIILCFLLFLSCETMYQFNRTINQQVKDNFNFPEKSELGQYANLVDSNIRVNLLIAQGSSFTIQSDSIIYKDGQPVKNENTSSGSSESTNSGSSENSSTGSSGSSSQSSIMNTYEITIKDIGSTFLSFSPISLNGKQISKVLKVEKKDDTNLYLISNIPLIYYLAGVLSAEMGSSFPQEALKAQTVAARTYFYATKLKDKPYDIENSINFQVFSFDKIDSFLQYVAQTDSLVMTYNGEIFASYFHSHSGGMLTTPKLVWGKESKPVFIVKEDIYSADTYKWKVEVGRFFLKTLFSRAGYDADGYCSGIEILQIGEDKRNLKIKVNFSNNKSFELTGDAFRKVVGTTVIKSTMFTLSYDSASQNYIFSGTGYGHGIGLSQYGARQMAQLGFNFEQILNFYYNNISIVSKK